MRPSAVRTAEAAAVRMSCTRRIAGGTQGIMDLCRAGRRACACCSESVQPAVGAVRAHLWAHRSKSAALVHLVRECLSGPQTQRDAHLNSEKPAHRFARRRQRCRTEGASGRRVCDAHVRTSSMAATSITDSDLCTSNNGAHPREPFKGLTRVEQLEPDSMFVLMRCALERRNGRS